MNALLLQPTLLSIAGSDPTGGAGIQADLKTITSIGVYGAAAITSLTVQNSKGVQSIKPLDVDFIIAQIKAVLEDHNVTHIKIGMTGNIAIINCLSKLLKSFPGVVVFDPVLASTTGDSLANTGALSALTKNLLPQISYLTPNTSELELLTEQSITTAKEAIECAMILCTTNPLLRGVIVKGGHLNESDATIKDFLVRPDEEVEKSQRRRFQNPHLHGTGCTYSSAFASYLCLGNTPVTAFQKAGDYMNTVISSGNNKTASTSCSNGPLLHYLT